MCGIIAVLRRKARRAAPTRAEIEPVLNRALSLDISPGTENLEGILGEGAQALASVSRLLLGPPGIECLRGEAV